MPPRKKSASPATGIYSGLIGGISELLEAARRASARSVNALMTATYWEIGRRIVEFEQGGAKRAEYGEELLERLAEDLTRRFGRGFSRFNLGRFRQFHLAYPLEKIGPTVSGLSAAAPIRATVSLESPAAKKRATLSLESATPIRQTLSAKYVTFENPAASAAILPTPSEETNLATIRQTASGKSAPPLTLADLARAFPLPWSHYVLLIGRGRSPEAFLADDLVTAEHPESTADFG